MSATLEIVEHNKDLMARLTGMFEAVLGSGGHLHWGYFDNKRRTLREAQDALIDQIARVARIDRDARVLDVGCGIGGTPLYLQRSHGCRTVGLTNSPSTPVLPSLLPEKGPGAHTQQEQGNRGIKFRDCDRT